MFDLAFDACLAKFALIEIISLSWAIVHQSASQWQGEYIGCPGLLDELKGGKAFSEQVQKHFPVHLSKSIIWNGNISGWSARDKQICHVLYATRITMLNFWEHTKFTNKIVLWPVIHYFKTRHRNFICTYLAKSMTEQWLKEFGIKYKVYKKNQKNLIKGIKIIGNCDQEILQFEGKTNFSF